MRGSRNFCQAGGGGGGDRGPTASHQLVLQFTVDPMVLLQRGGGGEGVQLLPGGGGVQTKPIQLVIFHGGSGPPNPPLDPHVGSPDATVCLQNHGLSKFK